MNIIFENEKKEFTEDMLPFMTTYFDGYENELWYFTKNNGKYYSFAMDCINAFNEDDTFEEMMANVCTEQNRLVKNIIVE